MTKIAFRKNIRKLAAKCGVLYWLRKLVLFSRGNRWSIIERKFISQILDPGDFVFDVGANRGQSSEHYINLGATVVAFEPQADLHIEIGQLCNNSPRLRIDPSGLGRQIEERIMHITEYDQVASLREDWEGKRIGETKVSISTLDAKIAQYGLPRYCKIDVEGWEQEVIAGLSQPIEIISFEYHISDHELDAARNVLERLNQLGTYWCNIRESSAETFMMPQFIRIKDFIDRFPNQLEIPIKDGYGDIFAVLDPAKIKPNKLNC